MDQIFISDLIARAIIGINDWERQKPQEVRINISLFCDLIRAGKSDDIRDSVDYRSIAKKVLAHTESAQSIKIESLAADLARICLEEAHVLKVKVRVEKAGAMRFSRSVVVEIERERGAVE